jgi:hypothetical protein
MPAKVEEDIAPGRRSYGICTRTKTLSRAGARSYRWGEQRFLVK